jgi:uncharacterized protein YkwD
MNFFWAVVVVITVLTDDQLSSGLPVSDNEDKVGQLANLLKIRDMLQAEKGSTNVNERRAETAQVMPPIVESYAGDAKEDDESQQEVAERSTGLAKRGTANIETSIQMYKSDGTSYSRTVEKICLFAHNHFRSQHKNTPNLVYDANLAAGAANYAKQLAATGTLTHSNGAYGENLWAGTNSIGAMANPAQAVGDWYAESYTPSLYDYNTFTSFMSSRGHFTAMNWKSATSVGCGVATYAWSESGYNFMRTIVVARYLGTANVNGQFTDNVLALASGAPKYVVPDLCTLIPNCSGDCFSMVPPATCNTYLGFCSMVKDYCGCQCP